MKLFIDSANLKEIKEISDWGILDGVTTNPSLVAKEGKSYHEVVREICSLVDGPISAEVISTDHHGMLKEAEILTGIHPNVTVKVPCIPEGLKAAKVLSSLGVKTNVTLVFSPSQALLAAKAGATFVSVFVGRMDDISEESREVIRDCVTIFKNYDFKSDLLVASIRHPLHIVEAALCGAQAATAPFKVLEQLIKHPLTDAGLQKFLEDAKKIPKTGK